MTEPTPSRGQHAPLVSPRVRVSAVLAGYRLALGLTARVPPTLAYPLLDRIGDLVRLAAPGPRAAVAANLEQVLGGRGRRHAWAVRGVFRHNLRNYYDTFRLPALSAPDISAFVELQGV